MTRTLEQQWELALREVERLESELTALQRAQPLAITAEQRQSLLTLSDDLEQVWAAPTTTWAERKDLLRLLIADVALTRHETGITVQIRWLTNQGRGRLAALACQARRAHTTRDRGSPS